MSPFNIEQPNREAPKNRGAEKPQVNERGETKQEIKSRFENIADQYDNEVAYMKENAKTFADFEEYKDQSFPFANAIGLHAKKIALKTGS